MLTSPFGSNATSFFVVVVVVVVVVIVDEVWYGNTKFVFPAPMKTKNKTGDEHGNVLFLAACKDVTRPVYQMTLGLLCHVFCCVSLCWWWWWWEGLLVFLYRLLVHVKK